MTSILTMPLLLILAHGNRLYWLLSEQVRDSLCGFF